MKTTVQLAGAMPKHQHPRRKILNDIIKNRYLYLLLLPALIYYIVFAYTPMYGITLAFKEYNAKLGILGSHWVGFEKFELLFSNSYFWKVLLNTIKISLLRLIIQTPFPVLIALLFSELSAKRTKKVLQTVYTLPHFLSWVIVSGIVLNVLDYDGLINGILAFFGAEKQVFLGNKRLFLPILYISEIWKDAGWSSLVYMAAIAGVSPDIYEAAELDGITRLKKIWYITLPSIAPTIVMMFVLSVGSVLNAGFDSIFNLSNPVVQEVSDVLDTYIYRITFQSAPDFSFSTAVGLFKSVVNISVLIVVDKFSRMFMGVGIFAGGSK